MPLLVLMVNAPSEKLLGVAKVSVGMRISIVEDAAAVLQVKVGDRVLLYENGKGEVVLRKG